jgi:hypothetical protein
MARLVGGAAVADSKDWAWASAFVDGRLGDLHVQAEIAILRWAGADYRPWVIVSAA